MNNYCGCNENRICALHNYSKHDYFVDRLVIKPEEPKPVVKTDKLLQSWIDKIKQLIK